MSPSLLHSIQLDSFLSFRPGSAEIELTPLNVIIGPNGAGKSNLIEAIELLRATPGDLAAAVRLGGGAGEWIWKGKGSSATAAARITAVLSQTNKMPEMRYRLEFTETAQRLELVDEALEESTRRDAAASDVYFYYRFQKGRPAINAREASGAGQGDRFERRLRREDLDPQQSVFSQRRDPDLYPEVTWVGQAFGQIATFREWSFGRLSELRRPQPADLPTDILLPDLKNLGLVLNSIEHSKHWSALNDHLRRFLPRFGHLSTRIQGGHVQVYLHEADTGPIPATRLSDGTIRFIALLAILLKPEPAPLICLEEPELGLHPDALAMIADLLVEASERTQVIVTTHSDVLVSALTDHTESVLVCEHLGGGTAFRRLEAEKLRFWLDQYRLGEIWRLGELGGNP